MIPPLKTGLNRCPFMLITKTVEGLIEDYETDEEEVIPKVSMREERVEFAECVGDKCMGYCKETNSCKLIGNKDE